MYIYNKLSPVNTLCVNNTPVLQGMDFRHWYFIQFLHGFLSDTHSRYTLSKGNMKEINGVNVYWIATSIFISHLGPFGINNRRTISRIVADIPSEILIVHHTPHGNGSRTFYGFTKFAEDKLFNTGAFIENEVENQTEDSTEGTLEKPEETFSALPEWFDVEWNKCLQSGKFQSCSKICSRGKNAGNINKYAEDFAKAVTSISDGTFYSVFGGLVKTKYALPEGLTPSEIVDGVISSVSGIAPNPFAQIIMRTAKTVSSPYLLWYSKQGNKTSPAKKVHPVREAVRVPQEWYNTRKPYKYIWNMPDGRGGTYQGYITDYFLENKVKGIIEKFDPRITAWAVDVIETYALIKTPKVHMPGLNTAIETMLDMAKYKSKQEGGNYLDYFWDIVMSIKIYTDTPLWHWFVKTYGMRSNDCISAIGVSPIIESRKQNEAQFRELLNVIA